MKLIDINNQGVWLLEKEADLFEAENLDDQQWIEHYNMGLRQVLINQEACLLQQPIDKNKLIHVLRKKLNALNLLVETQEVEYIQLRIMDAKTFNKIKDEQQKTSLNISRRSLFMKIYPFSGVTSKQKGQIKQKYLPHSVQLNMLKCTACDGCVKICPSNAMTIEPKKNSMAYTINSMNCDGCGECASFCDKDAISIDYYSQGNQQQYLIEEKKCLHCSHVFHVNYLNQQSNDKYCTVCQKYKHAKASLRIYDQ